MTTAAEKSRRSRPEVSFQPVAAAVALSGAAAIAAELSNYSGQSCGDFEGTWHFVNNQVSRGMGPGTLTAECSSGVWVVGPSSINNSTRHFHVIASGDLINASTDLAGKLVLSDFSCDDDDKKDPDPKK